MNLSNIALTNRIIEIRSGSHLYGTNTETSDEDFVGIFMPSEELLFGLQNVEECSLNIISKDDAGKNTKDAVDRKLYEYKQFCKLAMKNNPNILELLFVDKKNIVFTNDFGKSLLDMKYKFPYLGLFESFIGYAHAQKHKMILKADKLDDLEIAYDILSNEDDKIVMAQVLEKVGKPFFKKGNNLHIHIGDLCFEPGVYVKKARQLIKKRLDKFSNRKELIKDFGFDCKFGSHLIRLLREGIELLQTGNIQFPLTYANEILSIRKGKWSLEEVISYADELEKICEEEKKNSKLPKKPNVKEIESFVIEQIKLSLKEKEFIKYSPGFTII